MIPSTRYASSGGVSIAYQVAGEGAIDLLFLPGWISQIEHLWELPANRRFLDRIAGFCRLILFDRRGSGLSDRALGELTLEQEVDDAIAVLDAAGSDQAALLTYATGGGVGAALAAHHPERVRALIMYSSVARSTWAPDYDWAMTPQERERMADATAGLWGHVDNPVLAQMAPSMVGDAAMAEWFARLQRLAAGPAEARALTAIWATLDVRDLLGQIDVPTLVMHRAEDRGWDPRHSHYLAERIPGARYRELHGVDSLPFLGDSDAIVDEIEEFLTGVRSGGELTRALLTVMFTDIVDATATAARLGDGRWLDLLAAHDREVRAELARFGGREVKTMGDGFLATFAGPPSSALRCALAIRSAAAATGLDIRIGLHTGECELVGDDVGGMAVHIASRVGALAGPGEVLASGTAYGTVVGGPFTFEDRGAHELRGVAHPWPVFALIG